MSSIFVGNLPVHLSNEEIEHRLLLVFRDSVCARVKRSNNGLPYAFVELSTEECVRHALATPPILEGRRLRVESTHTTITLRIHVDHTTERKSVENALRACVTRFELIDAYLLGATRVFIFKVYTSLSKEVLERFVSSYERAWHVCTEACPNTKSCFLSFVEDSTFEPAYENSVLVLNLEHVDVRTLFEVALNAGGFNLLNVVGSGRERCAIISFTTSEAVERLLDGTELSRRVGREVVARRLRRTELITNFKFNALTYAIDQRTQ